MPEIFSSVEDLMKHMDAIEVEMDAVIAECADRRVILQQDMESTDRRQNQAEMHKHAIVAARKQVYDTIPKRPTAPAPEAAQWRGNLRPSSPLVGPLADVEGPRLADAYNTWWSIYTEGIRREPSSRRPEGVASEDAAKAADEANRAVLNLLSEEF